jgi:WD40 repeat protein
MGAGASHSSCCSVVQERSSAASGAAPLRRQSGVDFGGCPFTSASKRNPALDRQLPGFWLFEEFPGEWKEYDADASQRIDASFAQGSAEAIVVIKGRLHTVVFESMKDSTGTGAVKSVRRKVVSDDASSPIKGVLSPAKLAGDGSSTFTSTVGGGGDPFAVVESGLDTITRSLDTAADDPEALRPTLHSTIKAHTAPVFGTAFNLAGDKILTGSKDGTCKFWELETAFVVREFEEHPGAVLACAINKTKVNVVATGCDDSYVRIFSTGECPAKHTLEGHQHKVYNVTFTSDGKHLLSSSMDGCLRQWDATTGQCLNESNAHASSIFSLQSGPRSPWLAITASDDALLAAHDLRLARTVTHRYVGHEKTLWGCDIRFDEDQYLSCGMDSKVVAWDPRNPSGPYNTITSHRNPVHCVEYMPDGVTFLSSARDRTFRLTIAASGREVFACQAHESNVYKVTYNPATGLAMTCGSDALVKLWKLPSLVD